MDKKELDEIDEHNKKLLEETEADFISFVSALENNDCAICDKKLDFINKNEPCLHWLLKPKGIDKKDIALVLEKFEFIRVQTYLRWMANSENIYRNINDLVEEGKSDQVVEETIRYRNIEWSFSCARTDFVGHKGSYKGGKPHYHFQMTVEKRTFFRYNDMHINFFEEDLFMFKMKKGEIPKMRFHHLHASGMQEAMNSIPPEDLLNSMKSGSDDHRDATFRTQSIIIAKKGQKFSGDDILKMIEESEEKDVAMATLIHTIPNVDPEKTKIFIMPGDGVPEKAIRTPKNRGKKTK